MQISEFRIHEQLITIKNINFSCGHSRPVQNLIHVSSTNRQSWKLNLKCGTFILFSLQFTFFWPRILLWLFLSIVPYFCWLRNCFFIFSFGLCRFCFWCKIFRKSGQWMRFVEVAFTCLGMNVLRRTCVLFLMADGSVWAYIKFFLHKFENKLIYNAHCSIYTKEVEGGGGASDVQKANYSKNFLS